MPTQKREFNNVDITKDTKKRYPSAVELVNERTEGGKTHQIESNKFAIDVSIGAIHYKDDYGNKNEQWKDIDLTPVDMGDYWLIDKAPTTTKIFKDKLGYEIISKRSGHKITIELDSELPKDEDVEFEFHIGKRGIRLWKILKNDIAPKKFKWKITEENKAVGIGSLKFRENPEAIDADNGFAELLTTKTPIDSNSFYWEEEWTGKVNERIVTDGVDEIGDVKTPVYPISIDIDVNEEVIHGSDDAFEERNTGAGTFYLTDSEIKVRSWTDPTSYEYLTGGFRFQTVAVPQGATIGANSYIRPYFNNTGADDANFKIYANDVDDAVDFDTDADIVQRTRTDASASWVADGIAAGGVNYYSSPSIAAPLQELFDRGSWSTGNDLVLLLIANTNNDGTQIRVLAFEDYRGNPALLHIEYTEGAAGPSDVKSVNGVEIASVKSINTIAIASVKSINGIT